MRKIKKSLKKLQGIKVTPDMAQVNVVACASHGMCINNVITMLSKQDRHRWKQGLQGIQR